MAYTTTTWAALQTRLFDRLGDSVFYTNAGPYPEVTLYLREALRVWNVLARFWRQRFTFTTAVDQVWYRLPDLATTPANLLTYTMTVDDVIAEIQTHFMEPVSPTLWTGTDMFDLNEIVLAIQRRRDQFLLETSITLHRQNVTNAISSEGRMNLPENVVDVRRAAWYELTTAQRTHLWRRDDWAAKSTQYDWNANPTDPPSAYGMILTPPIQIQLIPPPAMPGSVDILSVQNGAVLDPVANTLLGIPDDYAWAVKYGAMADLLGAEGQGRAPGLAAYCEGRWQQGVELASADTEVFQAFITGIPVQVTSLQELDANYPLWETGVVGNISDTTPAIAVARDVFIVYPFTLTAGPNPPINIAMDIIRPAPIPVLGTDFVQLGQEQLDAVLDYAHHIASFKENGAEFGATQRQLKNMIALAADHNAKLKAMAFFRDQIEDRSQREDQRLPRREAVNA